ncbi:MAG: BtaA family protein, partial [Clostridia bacterium]|nr:BtaA family protein [Clostridia bacterium]
MNNPFSLLRYANCWEDTDILLEGLQIRENEVGLSVASGGDNTLA